MMEDLAMHILEILMNSIHACAKNIKFIVQDSTINDKISMSVEDDGKGMSSEQVQKISSPFMTGRSTRKVGLGVAFLKGLTEQCNGDFLVESEVGKGTRVLASVQKSFIDTPPMGNLGEIIMECIQANEEIDYIFHYMTDTNEFVFNTKEIKKELDGVSILEPSILLWIKDYVNQQVNMIKEDEG
ncbi:MAG: ATP-binding protein [Solobacterium sp.]|nr:ATP-binding protein [Solobacterium sp.]